MHISTGMHNYFSNCSHHTCNYVRNSQRHPKWPSYLGYQSQAILAKEYTRDQELCSDIYSISCFVIIAHCMFSLSLSDVLAQHVLPPIQSLLCITPLWMLQIPPTAMLGWVGHQQWPTLPLASNHQRIWKDNDAHHFKLLYYPSSCQKTTHYVYITHETNWMAKFTSKN